MARSAPMGGKGGGQSVPYQPAGFGQNQQFSGGFGMGTGGFSQPQFGQPPQFGGGFGGGFGMQQQPPNQLVGINTPPVMDQRVRDQRARDPFELSPGVAMPEMGPRATTGQEQLDAVARRQLGAAFGGLGDFLKGGSPPIAGKDYIPLVPEVGAGGGQYVPRGGAQERFQREAGRITDMRYRGPGRVLPPGRFQPFPQPQPQPDYNRLPQPMPMPRYGNFPPRRMPGYGNFPPRLPPRFQQPRPQPMPMPRYGNIRPEPMPGLMPGYGGFPGPMPMPRYQPALPSRLGSPTMYQGRGFTPNYGVPRSMIPPQEYQLFDQGGLGGFF